MIENERWFNYKGLEVGDVNYFYEINLFLIVSLFLVFDIRNYNYICYSVFNYGISGINYGYEIS